MAHPGATPQTEAARKAAQRAAWRALTAVTAQPGHAGQTPDKQAAQDAYAATWPNAWYARTQR